MLLIKTEIRKSNIEGLGLFTLEPIPVNTVIWKFMPGFDLKFSEKDMDKFPLTTTQFIKKYAYLSKKSNLYVLSSDDSKYWNHAVPSNCLSFYYSNEEEVLIKTLRNIQIGEELTEDYGSLEEHFIDIWTKKYEDPIIY